MRLCSIASGSSGNCIYVGSEQDTYAGGCGHQRKEGGAGLNSIWILPEAIWTGF